MPEDNTLGETDDQLDYLSTSPDFSPVALPDRNVVPNVSDRLGAIEDILHISY